MKQIYRKCDVCKGDGYVTTLNFEHGQTGNDGITAICSKCNGKGYIETDLFIDDDIPNDFPKYITRQG